MNCKVPRAVEFRTKFGFNQYNILINKEQSVATKKQHYLQKKNCYNILFWDIELICIFLSIDQQQKLMKKETKTDVHKEIKRQKAIEKELDCELIRINLDGCISLIQ